MKKLEKSVNDKLRLEVIEYAFMEWLIHRGIFTVFRANYDRIPTTRHTFRDCLRDHIRYVSCRPSLGPGALISSAFMFASTPEGYDFWIKHSDAWKRFYDSL
jgi:hypothetical protein